MLARSGSMGLYERISMYSLLPTPATEGIGIMSVWSSSITSRTTFGRSDLIHLGDPLLELYVLALLVAMAFVLLPISRGSHHHQPQATGHHQRTSHFHGR